MTRRREYPSTRQKRLQQCKVDTIDPLPWTRDRSEICAWLSRRAVDLSPWSRTLVSEQLGRKPRLLQKFICRTIPRALQARLWW